MVDLSSYMVTGTNDPTKQISVTKWNALLTDLGGAAMIYLSAAQASVAATIEGLISATTNGADVVFPLGTTTLDRPVRPSKPVRFRGYGAARGMSGGTGRTQIVAPAGFPAFDLPVAAQQTLFADMKITQASRLSTVGTASYAPGTSTTAITGCTLLDIQNGMIIGLEGAGTSLVVPGRTAAMTSGGNTVTITSSGSYGNAISHIGAMIEIAGAGAAGAALIGYIGTWVPGSLTLVDAAGAALNASTPVTAAAITVRAPLVAKVTAGGGTASLTIDSFPDSPQAVTAAKIRHWAPGIYSIIQCHGRDLEIDLCDAGAVLSGITTGGAVADNGTFYNCMWGTGRAGVVFQGSDAQVNSFYGCNFAGSEVGFLDDSFLGNYAYGCHWSSNCGIQVFRTSAVTQIIGGYVGEGASFMAPQTGNTMFFGTVGLINGAGLKGWASLNGTGGLLAGPAITLAGPITAQYDGLGSNAAAVFSGGMTSSGTGQVLITNNNNAYGGSGTATGYTKLYLNAGAESFIISGLSMFLDAESGNMQFRLANITMASVESYGINLVSGKVLKVNGTQVVGAQGASLPADATDLATALTLVNAIKARLKTTGGHGLVAD